MGRVVITGVGAVSALGNDWQEAKKSLEACRNKVRRMDAWEDYAGLFTKLAAPVGDFALASGLTRKKRRTMGRVSLMAVSATERALEGAGLLGDPLLKSGDCGIAYGSSTGSTDAVIEVASLFTERNVDSLNATTYLRMMGHTAAANIGIFFGVTGRIIPTSTACTSGSQGIGYAYECIKNGYQRVMLAGGGEELCISEAAVFDRLYATSTVNDTPELTPRPFDARRDGLVIGEGACTLVLEDLEHARARGAPVLAEIAGFATNSDGMHATRPSEPTVMRVMEMALQSAGIPASEIGYVNAHATATEHGDIVETIATNRVFGPNMPVSSLKSYIGHTLGACGSLETWLSMQMMLDDWYAPTINLDQVDERCADLDYLVREPRTMSNEFVMNNNFAFAGINTSIILRRLG